MMSRRTSPVVSKLSSLLFSYSDRSNPLLRLRGCIPTDETGVDMSDKPDALSGSASAHLAAIIGSSDDAIISKNLNSIITTWNFGAETIFGYAADEVVGQPITMLIPADMQDQENTIIAKIKAGERVEHFVTKRVTKSGRLIDVSITVSPIYGPEGIIIGASKIARNVTQARRFESYRAALARLSEETRDIEDADEIAYIASKILGETLEVSRAGYGIIDTVNETITIERDWNAPGIKSLSGVLQFRDYGSYIEDLKRGETVVFADAETDPRTAANADALKAISAQSVINMPVTEHGRSVALLYLNHAEAREWPETDLDFIRGQLSIVIRSTN